MKVQASPILVGTFGEKNLLQQRRAGHAPLCSLPIVLTFLSSVAFPAYGLTVSLTQQGIVVDSGKAGRFTLRYPALEIPGGSSQHPSESDRARPKSPGQVSQRRRDDL